jgi:RND family efflux transporter MFP subunit
MTSSIKQQAKQGLRPISIKLAASLLSLVALSATADDLFTAKIQQYPNWFALEAKMEAVNESTLSAQTSGRIQAINVDVNDYVKQGDIIIQLRDKQQRAAVEQAQAGLTQAKAANVDAQSKLKQSRPLYKQGSISKGTFDTIKANSQSAAATVIANTALLKQATEQLSYTQVRAPYSGIVKSRLVEAGESVNPGTPLIVGLSLAKLRAVADIPQRFAPNIGSKSEFQVVNLDQTFKAEKVTVFPYADANSHSFKVRVDINAEGSKLFPGMWVKLNIPMGEKKALLIPKTAVMQKGELSGVYVKTDTGFKLRQVRLGETHSDQINILAGLRDGETIATDAYAQMEKQEIK